MCGVLSLYITSWAWFHIVVRVLFRLIIRLYCSKFFTWHIRKYCTCMSYSYTKIYIVKNISRIVCIAISSFMPCHRVSRLSLPVVPCGVLSDAVWPVVVMATPTLVVCLRFMLTPPQVVRMREKTQCCTYRQQGKNI